MTINVGQKAQTGAYFFNQSGLQFSSNPSPVYANNEFLKWMACDWARGVPQLFAKLPYYEYATPAGCADVNLVPKYL